MRRFALPLREMLALAAGVIVLGVAIVGATLQSGREVSWSSDASPDKTVG